MGPAASELGAIRQCMDTIDRGIPKVDSVSVVGDRESFRKWRSFVRIGTDFFDYTHGGEVP